MRWRAKAGRFKKLFFFGGEEKEPEKAARSFVRLAPRWQAKAGLGAYSRLDAISANRYLVPSLETSFLGLRERAGMATVPLYHWGAFYEPFAAISHLAGAVLFAWLGWLLVRRGRGNSLRMTLLAVYAAACVFQFSMSGVYHMLVRDSAANRMVGRLDHAAVFLLIAGIFSPIYGLAYRGRLRRIALALIWLASIGGVLLTTVVSNDASEGSRLALYQAMGWSGIVALIDLWRRFGFTFVWPMIAGSLMMSVAGLTQELGWPAPIPGVIHAHETFHIVLLIGAIQQWLFIWQLAGDDWSRIAIVSETAMTKKAVRA